MNVAEFVLHVCREQPWMQHAACRGQDPNVMVPNPPNNAVRDKRAVYAAALQVCGSCPVVVECGDYGRDERFGVWGGTVPQDRSPRRRRSPVEHGTNAGHAKHLREGSAPCQACKTAHTRHKVAHTEARRNAS